MADRENRVAWTAIWPRSTFSGAAQVAKRPNCRAFRGVGQRMRKRGDWLAGAPGFEPGNGGIKIRCLTTWLRPTGERRDLTGKAGVPQQSGVLPESRHRG